MTSAFNVSIAREGETAGNIEGEEVARLTKFLQASFGVPQFDVEFEGYQYCHCVLRGEPSLELIAFAFQSVVEVGEPTSSPHLTYI